MMRYPSVPFGSVFCTTREYKNKRYGDIRIIASSWTGAKRKARELTKSDEILGEVTVGGRVIEELDNNYFVIDNFENKKFIYLE